jgi:hypothetical protein
VPATIEGIPECRTRSHRWEAAMSLKQWEKKVLQVPGVDKRVREIEDELRLEQYVEALARTVQ